MDVLDADIIRRVVDCVRTLSRVDTRRTRVGFNKRLRSQLSVNDTNDLDRWNYRHTTVHG